jgi:hypothetical protein
METKFVKNYVGKGTKVKNLDIVKITLNVEDILKFKHEFEGVGYITFEVALMQQPDKFNRTHTVYCTTKENVEEPKTTKPRIDKPKLNKKGAIIPDQVPAGDIPY